MPTPTKGPRLGSGPAHQRLLLAGLATQLFEHRSITTTEAKARRLRPYAERLVSFAKKGDLASRRQVMKVVRDKSVVHELFTEIGPAMAERPGGYTRITRIGTRKGDNAPLAVIELVMEPVASATREAQAATARSARGNVPAPAATAVSPDADGQDQPDQPVAEEPATDAAGTTAPEVVTGEVVEPDVEAPGADAVDEGSAAPVDDAPVADAGDTPVTPDEGATDERATDEAATDEDAGGARA